MLFHVTEEPGIERFWQPMVGFIFMVDEFRRDNGTTRFVPGSHRWPHAPSDVMQDATADYEGQVSVWGPPGS